MMRIVFHGENPASFSAGFADLVGPGHQVAVLPDALGDEDRKVFATADVLVTVRFDGSLPRPERLRLLQVPGAGYDGIAFAALPAGVVVCNCFGHEPAIAEYVLGALLMRRIPFTDADRELRQGRWTYRARTRDSVHGELAGSTIGLLGFGHIGQALAMRARAFAMKVHVANRTPVGSSSLVDRYFGLDELPGFWASADSFVVTLPLSPETRGLVGAEAFAAMRPDAVVINVGRGPVVDEAALYQALADRRIGGAIIDTWYDYPTAKTPEIHPSTLPFHELPNVLMTPHMSGWTEGTIRRRQAAMAENVARLAGGRPLLNPVTGPG
jgi:phosphoglycerate dehydrogenase-like enzyme